MWGFIAGEGFGGILDSFGWIPIDVWLGLAFARADGSEDLTQLRSVSHAQVTVQPGTDLARLREQEIAEARRAVADTPGLLLRAVGLNPQTWSLVQFDYWSRAQAELPEGAYSYEVLHVAASQPEALRPT